MQAISIQESELRVVNLEKFFVIEDIDTWWGKLSFIVFQKVETKKQKKKKNLKTQTRMST